MELQEHCFTVLYFELQANNGCLKKKEESRLKYWTTVFYVFSPTALIDAAGTPHQLMWRP